MLPLFGPLISLLFWLYLFSYFGDEVTRRYAGIGDIIFQCDWFLFSREMQKMLPMILMIAKKPVYMRGFANIYCTREAFKQVLKFHHFFVCLSNENEK